MNVGFSECEFARFSTLAGPVQSVPRAELSAALDILERVPSDVELEIVADAEYVVKIASSFFSTISISVESAKNLPYLFGPNGDLWKPFLDRALERSAPTLFRWAKSHATALQIATCRISVHDFLGNTMVDAFASEAANIAELPEEIVSAQQFSIGRTIKVQKRLVGVLARIQEFDSLNKLDKAEPEIAEPQPDRRRRKISPLKFVEMLKELGHEPSISITSGKLSVRCNACKLQCCSKSFREVISRGRCLPISSSVLPPIVPAPSQRVSASVSDVNSADLPCRKRARLTIDETEAESLLHEPPLVGKRRLHESHTLEIKRGIIICLRCGCHCVTKAVNLAKPCTQPSTKGLEALNRWHRGMTPLWGLNWPNSLSNKREGIIWRSVLP